MKITDNLIKVFEMYVCKTNPYYPDKGKEDCKPWKGYIHKTNYGRFEYGGEIMLAHRMSYWIYKEEPDPGLKILHTCDYQACVNPEHLFEVTQFQNIQDAVNRDRHNYGERHGMSELKEVDILDIRKRFAAGERREVLAKEYNVANTHINRICTGEVWAHVGGPLNQGRRLIVDPDDIAIIKEMYKSGKYTQKELAKIYGISRSYVTKIINEM